MAGKLFMNGLAVALLAAQASSHIIMTEPVPFDADTITKDPLGSGDYPCKQGLGYSISKMNQMQVGKSNQIAFKGSAVHGGGSCQLSITRDTKPTSKSQFKVIKSIEGGCPGTTGSTETFDYTLPDSVPNGKATFAWTWFAKLSGQPEMYMNCAPIDVSGGADDDTEFQKLPDMMVANVDETSCESPQNFDTEFPDPGENVQKSPQAKLKAPSGSCGASGSGGSFSGSSSSAPAGGSSSAAPVPSSSAAPAASSSAAAPGVFVPGASSTPAAVASSTLATSASAAPVASTPAAPVGTGSSSAGASNGTSCSENDAIVCNGASKFGICNNGQVTWQSVAPGTQCSNGQIQKRSVVRHRHLRSPHEKSFI